MKDIIAFPPLQSVSAVMRENDSMDNTTEKKRGQRRVNKKVIMPPGVAFPPGVTYRDVAPAPTYTPAEIDSFIENSSHISNGALRDYQVKGVKWLLQCHDQVRQTDRQTDTFTHAHRQAGRHTIIYSCTFIRFALILYV